MRESELRGQVGRLAAGLRRRFAPGELLAIWLGNGPDLLALYLACFRTGVVPLPLHAGMKWPEVRAIVAHAKARALVADPALVEPHAAELAATTLDTVHTCAELEEGAPDDARVARAPDDLALVLHTSGSTGLPKGVMLSRAQLDAIVAHRRAEMQPTPESVAVVGSCLTQSVGLYQCLAYLEAGAEIVLLDSYEIEALVEAVNLHAPTHLVMVVSAWDALLHHPEIDAGSFACTRFASVGADRVTARVQERFVALTGRPLRASYGLTESSWAVLNRGERADKRLALGREAAGVQVSLRAPDGREVAPDEVGEIHVRSPRTMLGYLHDEARSREALVDGWLASGDLARRDADGWLWFCGRKKHLLVLASGDVVSPLEVENAILEHPAVSACRVLGARAADGSEVPRAFVTRRDAALSIPALLAFLRERLSYHKLPREIEFEPAPPLGPTGKPAAGR